MVRSSAAVLLLILQYFDGPGSGTVALEKNNRSSGAIEAKRKYAQRKRGLHLRADDRFADAVRARRSVIGKLVTNRGLVA